MVAIFRRYPLPAWVSVGAIGLGIGPGWRFLWTSQLQTYEPATAVLTATLIALVWTAHFTFQAVKLSSEKEQRERVRRDRECAFLLEALAEELAHLDSRLAMIEGSPRMARFKFLRYPQLRECLRRADLFPPKLAAARAGTASFLTPLPSILSAYRPDPTNPQFAADVQQIVRNARSSVSRLAAVLLVELESTGSELHRLLSHTAAPGDANSSSPLLPPESPNDASSNRRAPLAS